MANMPVDTGNNGAPVKEQDKKKKPLVPPEEKFWQRYSPHHEAPLSGFSSLFLHVGIIGLVLFVAYVLYPRWEKKEEPIPFGVVMVDGDAGGGGELNGAAEGTGRATRAEDVGPVSPPQQTNPVTKPPEIIPEIALNTLNLPETNKDDAQLINDNKEQFEQLEKAGKEVSQKLFKGLQGDGRAPRGQGGSGEGGGKGDGVGKGVGDGTGGGKLSQRQKRQIRWHLTFNTRGGGQDYLRQLASLGAILAVPQPNGDFRIIRDLRARPAAGEVEDITKIQRIFWVDSDSESVQSLAAALGVRGTPPYIAAFFPQELEAQLLKLELAHRGKRESEIRETRFHLKDEGGGHFTPFVAFQK